MRGPRLPASTQGMAWSGFTLTRDSGVRRGGDGPGIPDPRAYPRGVLFRPGMSMPIIGKHFGVRPGPGVSGQRARQASGMSI